MTGEITELPRHDPLVAAPKTFDEFWHWVHTARPGDCADYYVGDLGKFRAEIEIQKRNGKKTKRHVADAAMRASAERRVFLFQRRISDGIFVYRARKLGKPQ